jgi:hypothetical protein
MSGGPEVRPEVRRERRERKGAPIGEQANGGGAGKVITRFGFLAYEHPIVIDGVETEPGRARRRRDRSVALTSRVVDEIETYDVAGVVDATWLEPCTEEERKKVISIRSHG